MKKRIISCITLTCIAISLCFTAAFATEGVTGTEEQVVVTVFEDYLATEDTLTAENISDMNTTAEISLSEKR